MHSRLAQVLCVSKTLHRVCETDYASLIGILIDINIPGIIPILSISDLHGSGAPPLSTTIREILWETIATGNRTRENK